MDFKRRHTYEKFGTWIYYSTSRFNDKGNLMAFLAAAAPVISAGAGLIGALTNKNQGAGYQAQAAPIQTPFTSQQITDQYGGANSALQNQQAFLQQLQNQGGLQNQQQAFQMAQQQALGQGPNPALAQLAQATQANTANQAALMAGQRGAAGNVGLMARQAAMQGGANQQNAAGQAATLQAQQQLAGQQQMANIAGQQVANTMQGQAQNIQGTQGLLGNMTQGMGQQNQAQVNMQSNMNNANAQIAGLNQQAQTKLVGGALGAIGPAANVLGGMFGKSSTPALGNSGSAVGSQQMTMAHGGQVQAGPQSHVGKHLHNMKSGGHVPGHASIAGDSPKNDTVKAILSPGEVVIPRSIMQSKNPAQEAAKFVQAVMAKQGMRK
jgi:hypothetical protein